jgi:hypothetical protein
MDHNRVRFRVAILSLSYEFSIEAERPNLNRIKELPRLLHWPEPPTLPPSPLRQHREGSSPMPCLYILTYDFEVSFAELRRPCYGRNPPIR